MLISTWLSTDSGGFFCRCFYLAAVYFERPDLNDTTVGVAGFNHDAVSQLHPAFNGYQRQFYLLWARDLRRISCGAGPVAAGAGVTTE